MRLVCIANPKSRNGAVGRSLAKLRALLDTERVDAVIMDLTADDFTKQLHAELKEHPDAVVMGVGGDGTHFSLVNTLQSMRASGSIDQIPTYALCPMGTGNDVAKSIGQKVGARNLSGSVEVVVKGDRVPCDLGRTDDTFFLDMLSAGWDVRALQIRDRMVSWLLKRPLLKRCFTGYMVYFAAAVAALFGRGRWPMTITLDDDAPLTGTFAGILINNGPVHAGEFILTPRATMTDGVLDVRVFRNRFTYLLAFVRGWRVWPRFIRGSGSTHRQCRSIRLETNASIPLQVDGEYVGSTTGFAVSVEPEALTLCIPAQGKDLL